MPVEFVMPKLGLTMEAGTIVEWLADDGAQITAGDSVLVIETDKVETEVEAPASGVLHRTGAVGSSYDCGALIGLVLADGEVPPTAVADAAPTAPIPAAASSSTPARSAPAEVGAIGGRLRASPNARRVASSLGIALATVPGSGPGGRIVSEDVEDLATRLAADPSTVETTPTALVRRDADSSTITPATIAARQLADLLGVDLRLVPAASGDGRRQREDVAVYVRQQLAARAAAAHPLPASSSLQQQPTKLIPLTGMRGVIAERMHASLRDMAQLTLHLDASMDAVVADRAHRRARGAAPSFTDYVIAAVARALVEHPIVNSQVTDDGIALLPHVHIGVAVALDEGLVVPVIRDADRLDLSALADTSSRLVAAARSRKLSLGDIEGGTFSVTALGAFGVDGFTPVVNAPNAAILGIGRIRDEVRLVDGTLATSRVATLSLTWDHRVFDGAPAATFTARVAELLGDPAALDRTI